MVAAIPIGSELLPRLGKGRGEGEGGRGGEPDLRYISYLLHTYQKSATLLIFTNLHLFEIAIDK